MGFLIWGFDFIIWVLEIAAGMKIVELEDAGNDRDNEVGSGQIVKVDAKRALVGAGARILFYPTLLYNVLRNKMESEFRWWDEVDQVGLITFLRFLCILISAEDQIDEEFVFIGIEIIALVIFLLVLTF